MALRRSGIHVVGYSRRQSSCQSAIDAGAVDEGFTDLDAACRGSDVVVVASPVDKIAELAARADGVLERHAVITDVGSTKAKIINELSALSPSAAEKFVAAHPIAGSEKTGVQNATVTLMDDKVVILTPTADTDPDRVERANAFWLQTGSHTITMSPQEHDERLAAVSHVPHLVSSLLASLIENESVPLVGSGWRDMTRVAAGDPEMWTAICAHNRQAILAQLDHFSSALQSLRALLSDEDTNELTKWLESAKAKKESTL